MNAFIEDQQLEGAEQGITVLAEVVRTSYPYATVRVTLCENFRAFAVHWSDMWIWWPENTMEVVPDRAHHLANNLIHYLRRKHGV